MNSRYEKCIQIEFAHRKKNHSDFANKKSEFANKLRFAEKYS